MKRKSLALIDQIVAGSSNWITSALAASMLTSAAFGLFSRNVLVVLFAAGLGSTVSFEPWISTRAERVNLATARRDISKSVLQGALIAMLTASVAGLVAGAFTSVAVAASLIGAAAMVHFNSAIRLSCFACGQIGLALIGDMVWLVTTPALILMPGVKCSPWVAWLLGGILSTSVFGVVAHSIARRQEPTGPAAVTTAAMGWSYAADYGLTHLVATASVLALGVVSGDAALGAFSGTLLLFAPAALAFNSSRNIGVPYVTARLSPHATPAERRRTALKYLVPSLLSLTTIYVIFVLLLPDRIGSRLLGDTWPLTSTLRGVGSIAYLSAALATATVLSLRVAGLGASIAATRAVGVVAGGLLLLVLGFSAHNLLVSWALYYFVTALCSVGISASRTNKHAKPTLASGAER